MGPTTQRCTTMTSNHDALLRKQNTEDLRSLCETRKYFSIRARCIQTSMV